MILGNINQITQIEYLTRYNKDIKDAFEFIRKIHLTELKKGKNQIPGSDIFAIYLDYETSENGPTIWEAHKKYLDIQYIFQGTEKISHANINNLSVTKEYDASADVVLGICHDCKTIELHTGDYVMFFPEEAHMPGISNNEDINVKKLVVKVPINK